MKELSLGRLQTQSKKTHFTEGGSCRLRTAASIINSFQITAGVSGEGLSCSQGRFLGTKSIIQLCTARLTLATKTNFRFTTSFVMFTIVIICFCSFFIVKKRREKNCSGTLSFIKGAPLSNDQQYKQTTKQMAIQELFHPMTLPIRTSEALDRMMEGSAPGTDTVAFLHIKNLSEYCSVNLKVLHQYRASRRSCPRRQGAQGSTTSIACDLGLVSWRLSTVK